MLRPAFRLNAAAQELKPEELVRKVTADILESIQSDKELQGGNRKKALALAEQKILPYGDFSGSDTPRARQGLAPPHSRSRNALVAEFRSMLVRIYLTAMGEYRGQTMRVQPVKMQPEGERGHGSQPVSAPRPSAGHRRLWMRKTAQGWKIYDITVEGISLVITYRSEFQQIVGQSGIDGLIKQMADKNLPAGLK